MKPLHYFLAPFRVPSMNFFKFPCLLHSIAVCALVRMSTAEICVDKKHNVVMANSDPKNPRDAMIYDFGGVVYKADKTPACNNGRPTVLMPGIVTFLQGRLVVPRKYDLVRSGVMKMTVKSPSFDDPLCLKGKSQYVVMPDRFCTFDLCPFIGNDVCELLSASGVHTLDEMEKKLRFNRTQILPEPPSLFGISLLDLFSGEFSFGFTLEHEGDVILELKIPSNEEYLQIGIEDSSDGSSDESNASDNATKPCKIGSAATQDPHEPDAKVRSSERSDEKVSNKTTNQYRHKPESGQEHRI